MDKLQYDLTEAEDCLKELRSIKEEYEALEASLSDTLDMLETTWQGTGNAQIVGACESVREDSVRIRSSLRSAAALLERTNSQMRESGNTSGNGSVIHNAVYHFDFPEGD